jgi:hypothetical protein
VDTLLDAFVPAEQAADLAGAGWDGHRAGLADSSWHGDERHLR